MRVTASAPGKLVLLGEYAVLEGAPGLVLAVDRRAKVTLATIAGDNWEIVSPTLGLKASMRIGSGGVAWRSTPAPELAWLALLFERLPFASSLAPCRVELDSNPFYLHHADERTKLGLGSSAALTVALLGALHALAQHTPPSLDECIDVHRAIQRGRGSGVDIAASLAGGLSRFELRGGTPSCVSMQLSGGLHWRCVFSGRPASTGTMLATVAAWREREPTEYARHLHELATISSRGVDTFASNDAAAFLSSLYDYAQALARLGEASGADIASREHRAIGGLAEDCGVIYKSCGAGGGDVGVTFAVDDTRLREFAERAAQAGFPVIELDADPRGLETNVAG
ncbi:MAG: mevalonate kinase family protein [Rhodanobacteraceae bacterium]